MSTAPIARSALTSLLVAHLVDALGPDVRVGRGTAPQEGGWSGGQPNTGDFVPYVTVKTRIAQPWLREDLRRNTTSWQCNYALAYAGHKESACDDVADQGRAAVVTFGSSGPLSLGGATWSLQKVDVPRLGMTMPYRGSNPPYWEVSDDVSLWLSLERAP